MEWLAVAAFVGILGYIIWDVWLKKPRPAPEKRQKPDYIGSYDANRATQQYATSEQYFDEEYDDDPAEYIPQNPTFPDGKWVYIDNFAIAGTSFNHDNALHFIEEADSPDNTSGLILSYDPRNKYDKNAIKVEGWINSETNKGQIGFIPAEIAKQIADEYGKPKLAAKFKRGYFGRAVTIYINLYRKK